MSKFKKSLPVVLSILIALIIILITGLSSPKKDNIEEVYNVYLDGKLVGAVKSKDSLEKYIDEEQKELKKEFNVNKVYIPNGIDIEKCVTHKAKILSEKQIYDKIKEEKNKSTRCVGQSQLGYLKYLLRLSIPFSLYVNLSNHHTEPLFDLLIVSHIEIE